MASLCSNENVLECLLFWIYPLHYSCKETSQIKPLQLPVLVYQNKLSERINSIFLTPTLSLFSIL